MFRLSRKHRLRHAFSHRAFTMTEIVVSLGLMGLLAAATFFIFIQGRETRQIAAIVNGVDQDHQLISENLLRDLTTAVQVTGSSRADFYGVGRVKNQPRTIEEVDPDELLIISEQYSAYSIPVSVEIDSSDSKVATLTALNSTSDADATSSDPGKKTSYEAFVFLRKWVESGNTLFYVVNDRSRNLLQLDGSASVTPNKIIIQTKNSTPLDRADFQNTQNQLRAISIIRYRVLPKSNTFVREVFRTLPTPNSTEGVIRSTVLAKDVVRARMNYDFISARSVGVSILKASSPVSHPNEVTGTTSASVVAPEWRDIDHLILNLNFDLTSRGLKQMPKDSPQGYELIGDKATLQRHFVVRPFLDQGLQTTGLQGMQLECSPYDLNSRCNPDCAGIFTESEPTSLRYTGYLPGSDYCICAYNPSTKKFEWPDLPNAFATIYDSIRNNPDTKFKAPGNNDIDPPENARGNACLRLKGCDWRWLTPTSILACDICLHPPKGVGQKFQPWENVKAKNFVKEFVKPSGSTNFDASLLACNQHDVCDGVAFAPLLSNDGGSPSDFMYNACKCRTWDTYKDSDSGPTRGAFYNVNLGAICGLPPAKGQNPDEVSCPPTLLTGDSTRGTYSGAVSDSNAAKIYALRGDDSVNPQGLTPLYAALCACLNEVQNQGGPREFRIPTPVVDGGNRSKLAQNSDYGLAFRQLDDSASLWDFRNNRGSLPAELEAVKPSAEYDPYNSWGSLGSIDAAYTLYDPLARATAAASANCGAAFSTWLNGNIGLENCKTKLPAHEITNLGIPSSLADYSGYCSPKCGVGYLFAQPDNSYWNYSRNDSNGAPSSKAAAPRIEAEINTIRHIITGTPMANPLPENCGGPKSSSGTDLR